MQKWKIKKIDLNANILCGVFYFFGVILFNFDFGVTLIKGFSELLLYLCALVFFAVVYWSYKYQAKFNYKRFFIWALIAFVGTLLIEMVGTNTGMIFGNYKYGQVLRLQIFETPLVIGFNWVFLIVSGSEIARHFTYYLAFLNKQSVVVKSFITAVVSAILITFFDFIMEPIAVYLGYWNWGYDNIYEVPLQNYIAWFLVSLAFSLFYISLKIKIKSSFVQNIFWLQLLFFSLLRLFLS